MLNNVGTNNGTNNVELYVLSNVEDKKCITCKRYESNNICL